MLAVLKKIILNHKRTVYGKWKNNGHGMDLFSAKDKTLGLVGFGEIGSRVGKIAAAMGMKVIYTDPNPRQENLNRVPFANGVKLDQLLRKADIISLHVHLNLSTKGMISKSRLSLLKKQSILINVSRAELVDTKSLLKMLNSGDLFGEIKTISAINKTISSLRREKIFKTDDLVEIIAELKSGAVASIHMDLFGKYHEKKLEIITEKSKIEWHFDNTDLKSNNIKIFSGKRRLQSSQLSTREAPKILSAGKLERNAMYLRQIKHFLHCIKNKKQIRGDVACLKDGFQTMNVLHAARRSARYGRKVKVLQNAFYSDKK